jgi:2',3'-cyclic-nucleotide 2'-phosphodiesterase/3'-nucleotidase
MVECAQQWVPYIKEHEKPDLLIGMFHSGSDYTVGGSDLDTYKNENGSIPVAMKVDGFDIVLMGHDHQEKVATITNNFGHEVVLVDAQTGARCLGRVDIKLRRNGDGYDKIITPSLVDMRDVKPDSAFVATFDADVKKINEYVDAQIGLLTDTLSSRDALYGPSEFMDLIHNAQLAATGADVSFAGVLSTDALIPAGKLTMRHLFTLYKYENLLYTMRLTGDEIRRYLEYGYDRQYNQMKSPSDHLLNFKRDSLGNLEKNPRFGYTFVTPSFNFTSAAGIKYTVDVTKPAGERVTILSMSDGTPFDPNKEYKVAVNSYQASGGGGFFPDGLGFSKEETEAHIINASKKDVRKYIADYIREQGTITPASRNDWRVIPDKYFEAGKATDEKLMRGK